MKLIQRNPPVYLLGSEITFPDPLKGDDEGLIAVGGDFSPERLIEAYRRGIFPWFIYRSLPYWFSPNPRLVLFPKDLHLSTSLKRILKSGRFEVKYDVDFEKVIEGCAKVKRKEKGKTWITKPFVKGYSELFLKGYAHCVSVYEKGELVGGLYGVQVGNIFCGESMFSLVNNASKVAFVSLVTHHDVWNFFMVDCQVPSDHLIRFGAKEMEREKFLKLCAMK